MTPTPRTDKHMELREDFERCDPDFARQLERENAELLEALEACMKIIGSPHALKSECWATTDEINAAWDKGTASIAKTKGKP